MPTARSDKSIKGQMVTSKNNQSSALSNQTTQKKNPMQYGAKIIDSAGNFCSDTPQFNYLSSGEMPKTKLQYGDESSNAPSSIY